LRNGELLGFAFADRHARKIIGRQGLQAETALAAAHLQALVFQEQADFGGIRQRTQDFLQLACPDGNRAIAVATGTWVVVVIWISMSVASKVRRSPFFSNSTLDRMGRV
jgi:hypothetical protein